MEHTLTTRWPRPKMLNHDSHNIMIINITVLLSNNGNNL